MFFFVYFTVMHLDDIKRLCALRLLFKNLVLSNFCFETEKTIFLQLEKNFFQFVVHYIHLLVILLHWCFWTIISACNSYYFETNFLFSDLYIFIPWLFCVVFVEKRFTQKLLMELKTFGVWASDVVVFWNLLRNIKVKS